MIKVIINGDDFGYSKGVNYGIIDAHRYGILNSATMMMNMKEVDHAFELASKYPNLALGVHLVLTAGAPILTDGVGSLIGKDGCFKKKNSIQESFDLDPIEVEREWTAQIERFLASGRHLSHLDSHHHVHMLPELQEVTRRLSRIYHVPVRRGGEKGIEGVSMFSDVSLFHFYDQGVSPGFFASIPQWAEDGQTVEIMCHPAYLDAPLFKGASYVLPRLKELEVLMAAELPDSCELVKFDYY
ncbi:chitin disaccharide deacetylase [Bacillus testis]|uniref:chitin disaccharide deacetylase n=1 Tax=Bacillus testis TaxID=1622072 RepID=UPI00067F2001|nr:chitin disaccharide deacetylase [Bacillus testis]